MEILELKCTLFEMKNSLVGMNKKLMKKQVNFKIDQ